MSTLIERFPRRLFTEAVGEFVATSVFDSDKDYRSISEFAVSKGKVSGSVLSFSQKGELIP